MALEIDFAIALGLFFVFIVFLLSFLVNYIAGYTGLTLTSELRTTAYSIYNVLFSGKGVPQNWEELGYVPVKIGLATDLYRIPVLVTETNGTSRSLSINTTINFDSNCEEKAWNTTVRIRDEDNSEAHFQLYNSSFCSESFLNSSDLVFNLTLSAHQSKIFFVYFSPDKSINTSVYSLGFPTGVENLTVQVLPEEKLSTISISKLKALRNLSYDEVIQTLGTEYSFNLEISE
jgi:hypothetical protein